VNWLKQHLTILGLFHYILHYIVYYARITVIKVQYRVNFSVDRLHNITIWRKMQDIKKCNLRCAHTEACHNATEQTRPRVSDSH